MLRKTERLKSNTTKYLLPCTEATFVALTPYFYRHTVRLPISLRASSGELVTPYQTPQ